jgi:hypothetical protein
MKDETRIGLLTLYERGLRHWLLCWLLAWSMLALLRSSIAWLRFPDDRTAKVLLALLSTTITCVIFGFLGWYLLERFHSRNTASK